MSLLILMLVEAATPSMPKAWEISEAVEALTGSTTVTATLEANQPVLNMLGAPDSASMILRCKEGKLAAYVVWPQVIDTSITSSGNDTLLAWRADDQKIVNDLWSVSSDGTGAGMFSTGKAVKFLSKIAGAHKFVIRITGQYTQDASFSLGNFDEAALRVTSACGIKASPTKP